MNPTRVLCVENQPEYKAALKYMLEAVGYQVTVADLAVNNAPREHKKTGQRNRIAVLTYA